MRLNKPLNLLRLIFLTAGLLLAPSISAINLPRANPVPGGIAIVPVKEVSTTSPQVHFNDRRVMVAPNDKQPSQWLAIVGIPLDTKPGKQHLQVKGENGSHQVSFKIKKKSYKSQYITIKNKRKVDPTKKDMERILKEKKIIGESLRNWSDVEEVQMRFLAPVQGRLSSPFGLRRFFNKQPRKPHSGLDIAAPTGTPILAPSSGTVITTGNYFFNGYSVFLDHGNGLVSMFCHMSRIDVKPGQSVNQGESIGAVGKSGRATGPHLHWSVSLNDARVDPKLFFDDFKKQLKTKKRR